jgi:LPS export ABC transporter protein LptC
VTLCLGRHCGPGAGLAVALLVLITACDRTAKLREAPSPPFVFRRLDLRQQDAAGRPTWELTSPEARYDIRRGLAQALQPRGIVYAKGEPIYRLEASSGVVLNDGEVIQLEGRIRVTRMGQEPLLIEASQVRWLPAQKLLEIDRHPQAFDSQTRLSARRARFLLDRNLLELRGAPLVQRWQQRFDPLRHLPSTRPELWLQVAQLDWQPLSGDLTGRAPSAASGCRPAPNPAPLCKPCGPGRWPATVSARCSISPAPWSWTIQARRPTCRPTPWR